MNFTSLIGIKFCNQRHSFSIPQSESMCLLTVMCVSEQISTSFQKQVCFIVLTVFESNLMRREWAVHTSTKFGTNPLCRLYV